MHVGKSSYSVRVSSVAGSCEKHHNVASERNGPPRGNRSPSSCLGNRHVFSHCHKNSENIVENQPVRRFSPRNRTIYSSPCFPRLQGVLGKSPLSGAALPSEKASGSQLRIAAQTGSNDRKNLQISRTPRAIRPAVACRKVRTQYAGRKESARKMPFSRRGERHSLFARRLTGAFPYTCRSAS